MYMIRLEQCRIIYFKRFILRRYTALDHLICFDFASKLLLRLEEVSDLNFVIDITIWLYKFWSIFENPPFIEG